MFSGDCCAVSGSINHFYVLVLGGGYRRPLLKSLLALGDYRSSTRSQSFGELKREMNDRRPQCVRTEEGAEIPASWTPFELLLMYHVTSNQTNKDI